MISGAHVIVYTKDPAADRAFFRDVLRLPWVDSGDGWLIFALPPAEIAFHPTEAGESHQVWLTCADLAATLRELMDRGVVCERPHEERWGTRSAIRLPGGGWIGLYQPKHPTAIAPVKP